MNGFDDHAVAMQLVMLLTYLPLIAVLAVMALWTLMRLHQRPRSGWIVLGVVLLSGVQLGGLSALWRLMMNFSLPVSPEVMILIYAIANSALEVAISWLLILGLFGRDPFRWRVPGDEMRVENTMRVEIGRPSE